MKPEEAAQAQLDAYNARDIDAFLLPYAPDIELARLPGGEVFARGHAEMRVRYARLFEESPELHCELKSRICHDRFVVDHEEVTGMPGREVVFAVAIYEILNGRIARGWFLH
jgi:hypothetical protein